MKRFLRKELLILYLIILIGAYLRFQAAFTNTFAFTYDVGRDMLALWNIAYSHKFILIGPTTGLQGVFYGPWWYYFLVPFFILVSGNPQGIAYSMSFIGILTIVFSFIIGKKISGNFFGFSLAALIAASPVLVFLSSQIWSPNIAPLFILLIMFVVYKIFSTNKIINKKYYFFLGILLAFTQELEIVFGTLMSASMVLAIIVLVNKKIKLKEVAVFIFGALIIYSPKILFELRHSFLMTKSFINFLTSGSSSNNTFNIFASFLNRAEIIFNDFCATLALENQILGLTILIFITFSFILFYKKSNELIRKMAITSLIIPAVFIVGLTFFKHDIWPHYLVGLPIIYLFIFSLSLALFFKNKDKILPIAIVAMIFILNVNPLSLIINLNNKWSGDASVYKNQLEVVDYTYDESKGKNFKYVVYTPPVHDYTYRYLFMWYGSNKYHYLPSAKSNLAYFIIEPDPGYPDRPKWWLEARIKDGKIVKTHKFKSGIVVQTRIN
jgi:hypothetical protein